MDTRRQILLVAVVVLLIGATPALAAIASYSAPISGEVPVSTDQTPTAVIAAPDGSELNLVDIWEGDQLNITTPEGDIVVSGDPGAQFRIAVDDIEGAQTQITEIEAGGAWIELNPADKNRVDVRGDATSLAFSDIAVDDGSTDLQVSGPSGGTAEVRLHGLAASTEYALYDASRDEVLGTLTTDAGGTGAGTVELPDGTQALEVRTAGDFADPAVTDPQPTGEIVERPEDLSVNVTAAAYPATVEFRVGGDVVDTVEVTADGTVTGNASTAIDELGAYEWSATVTDALGRSDSVAASFETPSELTLREESNASQLITNTSATLRFFTVDGEIAITRDADGANISLEGLPNSEFVVFVESDDHYDRTVYLSSIFQQESIFLLNSTRFERNTTADERAIRSRFVYQDLTGDFPRAQTTIQIQRAIDVNGDGTSEFRTVAGDFWGASNEFSSVLEYGARYRVVLVNQETGEEYAAGSHIPLQDLTQTIRVSGLVEEAANASGVTALAELNESDSTIDIAYTDAGEATDELTIEVAARNGTVIYNDTVSGPLGNYGTSVELTDAQAEQDWVVTFDAGDRHRSSVPVGAGSIAIPFPVPGWVLTLLGSTAITFVGLLYGPRTAVLGVWSMVFVTAGLAFFSWGAFSGVSVAIAALVAAGVTLGTQTLG